MGKSIIDVVEKGICVGCGGCGAITNGRVKVTFNEIGFYQADISKASDADLELASKICPFSDDSRNEDEISDQVFQESLKSDERIGKYLSTYTAQRTDERAITDSSSGGMTSWIASELLRTGEVDGIIHVGPTESSPAFSYRISYTETDISANRKSMYHSTSFDDVMIQIRGDGLRYAFIGVPCFVRSARLTAENDPILSGQLRFFLGLVCGHMKSSGYAESMAWQLGVKPSNIKSLDFRIKDKSKGSRGYQFGVKPEGENEFVKSSPAALVGGNWGHSVFQLDACNFCDDIYAETADVALGDAWLPKFESDWRGANVVVSRNATIDEIVNAGAKAGEIAVEPLDVDSVAKAQAGNYRHRRLGLSVRLADDIAAGEWVPKKRVQPGYDGVSRQRIEVIRQRRNLSKASFGIFAQAKQSGRLEDYLEGIRPLIRAYDKWSRPTYFQRALGKAKRIGWQIIRRVAG